MNRTVDASMQFGYLAVLSVLLLTFAFTALAGGPADLEVVSKRYSSGYLPTVGSYVEYEVRLTNGGVPLENRPMNVSLVSDGSAKSVLYSVTLGPGESKIMHLGPFKMEQEGGHRLLIGLDEANLGYDSFTVYRSEAVQAGLIAIPLIVAGAGLVVFSLYRKRKAV